MGRGYEGDTGGLAMSQTKFSPKTIGFFLETAIGMALERMHDLGFILEYTRLYAEGKAPDFRAKLAQNERSYDICSSTRDTSDPSSSEASVQGSEDSTPFLVSLPSGLKVEIEAKNLGRSPAKHPQDGYPPFNRHQAGEIESRILNKAWTVDPANRILVLSELHTDIFTEAAVRLLYQAFAGRMVEVGYQVLKEGDLKAVDEIFIGLLTIFTILTTPLKPPTLPETESPNPVEVEVVLIEVPEM